ncbi:MAG: hypothetical protein LBR33_02105 [Propionibacteriaceae bacterium]|jgi:hypothetical protein|nr:hypothetical protein [Propionibacteriaceae bacterium]
MSIRKKILTTTAAFAVVASSALLAAPPANAVDILPVAASNCGSAKLPAASTGIYIDVYTQTPWAKEIDDMVRTQLGLSGAYFNEFDYTIGCYKTPGAEGWIYDGANWYWGKSGTYSWQIEDNNPFPANNPTTWYPNGDANDAVDEARDNGTGYYKLYAYEPLTNASRQDLAKWLGIILINDYSDAYTPDTWGNYLDGPDGLKNWLNKWDYTNASYTQGWKNGAADGNWDSGNEPTFVTIPVGDPLYREFQDIKGLASGTQAEKIYYYTIELMANTVIDAQFNKYGELVGGQRLVDGFLVTAGDDVSAGGVYNWNVPKKASTWKFGFDQDVLRQDYAAWVYRIVQAEVQSGQHPDLNVDAKEYIAGATAHQDAVYWLYAHRITIGYNWGSFEGLWPVYRQDAAAFVWKIENFIEGNGYRGADPASLGGAPYPM